ncbi:hypothetical protein C2S52_009207 [Perilla frutescens var. hirtella]|nr:hypothetical protein C2S51_017284 [Perilla frutescens var. frutescens]KAH6784248.1 hypothetical protein C2S52_009207 [Perilla frutescens var. hirtella]
MVGMGERAVVDDEFTVNKMATTSYAEAESSIACTRILELCEVIGNSCGKEIEVGDVIGMAQKLVVSYYVQQKKRRYSKDEINEARVGSTNSVSDHL